MILFLLRKKNRIDFCTIVLHSENLELRKDPGQIPYHFGKTGKDISAKLVTYYYTLKGGRKDGPLKQASFLKPDQQYRDYPFLLSEVKGLQLEFLDNKGRGRFYERSVLKYLLKKGSAINILNLFHYGIENIFYSFVYKILNPGGKIFLKLDIDLSFYKQKTYFFNATGVFKPVKVFFFLKIIQPFFFKLVHTISAESQTGMDYFRERFNVPRKKMMLLPNGVDEDIINSYVTPASGFSRKENIIITVGRIGTAQKNNEMLLNALTSLDLQDWKVYFIGSVQQDFQVKIERFFLENPGKRQSVIFAGQIDSPAELYGYYNKAKVFCLTSQNEGFPLSACEAAYFGNYLLMTDKIDCFDELTDSGKHGKKIRFNDTGNLTECLKQLISDPDMLEKNYETARAYARKNLTWQALIPRLYNRLMIDQ